MMLAVSPCNGRLSLGAINQPNCDQRSRRDGYPYHEEREHRLNGEVAGSVADDSRHHVIHDEKRHANPRDGDGGLSDEQQRFHLTDVALLPSNLQAGGLRADAIQNAVPVRAWPKFARTVEGGAA